MKEARERILAAAPYGGSLSRPAEPVSAEDLSAAVSAIVESGVKTREDGRILAYAWYAGELQDEVQRLAEHAGMHDMLVRELRSQTPRTYDEPQQFAASIENGGSELSLVRMLADENVGWAFAMLHLVRDVAPIAVASATGGADDVASLIPMFWLIGSAPDEVQSTILERLLYAGDGFSLACATQLLIEWIRSNILRDSAQPFDLSAILAAAPRPRALAMLGGLIDELQRWLNYAQVNPDAQARTERWRQSIEDIGRGLVVAPNDVDKVLEAAGTRDVQALATMSYYAKGPDFDQRTGERIARHALALFKREFASFMERNQDDNLYDAAHPEWVTNPLVEALSNVGLSVQDFNEAFSGLACDTFSRMTRHMAWLRDRPRSIILLVIAGCVALNRSDAALLSAVKDAARQVESQPAGFSAALDASKLPDLEEKLGFRIPSA